MIDPQSIVHDISSEPLDNNIIISNRLNRDIFIRWLRGIRLKLLWDVKAHPLVVNSCLYHNYSYTVLTNYFFTERKMTWYNIQVPWGAMWIVDLFWKIPFIYCLYLCPICQTLITVQSDGGLPSLPPAPPASSWWRARSCLSSGCPRSPRRCTWTASRTSCSGRPRRGTWSRAVN